MASPDTGNYVAEIPELDTWGWEFMELSHLWSPDIVKLLLAANITKINPLCLTTYIELILIYFSSENTSKEVLSALDGKLRMDSEHK